MNPVKPQYAEGQEVSFEDGTLKGHGLIRGLAFSNTLLDVWIVEVVEAHGMEENYTWSCITLPHSCLSRRDAPVDGERGGA